MEQKRFQILYTSIVTLIVIAELLDLYADLRDGGLNYHVLIDMGIVLLVLSSVVYIWIQVARQLQQARQNVERTRHDLEQFRRRHTDILLAMRQAMHDQFAAWKFSAAETRVAEQLIRGYSSREIAARAGRSERTVRNQMTTIYEKSGMTGRSDLAAFFLAEILGDETGDADEDQE